MDARGGAGAEGQRVVRLANRYTLGDRLGGGGMAVVHRAFDERLHRDVAIKLLAPSPVLDRSARARFESEARAAASINHPRVVAVYDVGTDGELLFIVMECLSGPSLADELRGTGPMPVDSVLAVLTDVLDGLEAAHSMGVLHRDIKPSNVLFDVDGRAKLADFGIATSGPSDLTDTGVVVGTPAYLAPERIAGRPATVRSDLYAVGVVAYEALAGVRPFTGETPLAVVRAIDEARPVPLGDVRADVPAAVSNAVMGAIAADPERRPASAAAFARQLDATRAPTARPVDVEAAVATLPAVPLRDDAPTDRLPRPVDDTPPAGPPSRRWIVFVLAGAVAIGLVLGTLWSAFRDDDDSPAPSSSVTTTPQPSLPEPLDDAFDRLEEVVQP